MTARRWCVVLAAAAVVLAACGGEHRPIGNAAATSIARTTPASATTAAPASSATGSSLEFRGMTLAGPAGWKVDASPDGATVSNGRACVHSDLLGRDVCPGLEVYGPDGIAHGYENRAYRLDQPFHPGTDVSPCTTAPDNGLERTQTLARAGFAKVGPKTAHYRAWRVTCVSNDGKQVAGQPHVQRVWYLPTSQILVVDEWSTAGLAEALVAARFG